MAGTAASGPLLPSIGRSRRLRATPASRSSPTGWYCSYKGHVSTANPSRLVSVKLTPVGRPHSFVSPERAGDRQPHPGDRVVVQGESGTAVGTVVRSVPELVERRLPAGDP